VPQAPSSADPPHGRLTVGAGIVWNMDLIEIVTLLVALVGMVVFALLATVPTMLELQDPSHVAG